MSVISEDTQDEVEIPVESPRLHIQEDEDDLIWEFPPKPPSVAKAAHDMQSPVEMATSKSAGGTHPADKDKRPKNGPENNPQSQRKAPTMMPSGAPEPDGGDPGDGPPGDEDGGDDEDEHDENWEDQDGWNQHERMSQRSWVHQNNRLFRENENLMHQMTTLMDRIAELEQRRDGRRPDATTVVPPVTENLQVTGGERYYTTQFYRFQNR